MAESEASLPEVFSLDHHRFAPRVDPIFGDRSETNVVGERVAAFAGTLGQIDPRVQGAEQAGTNPGC